MPFQQALLLLLLFVQLTAAAAAAIEHIAPVRTCASVTVPPCLVRANRDVLFLLDTSNSMDRDLFYTLQLDFVQSAYCAFNNQDMTRTGLITFSSQVLVRIPLKKYTVANWFALVDALRNDPKTCCSLGTPTAEAFKKAREVFTSNPSSNDRVTFVMTDGSPFQVPTSKAFPGSYPFPTYSMAAYRLQIVPTQANMLKQISRLVVVGLPEKDGSNPDERYFKGIPEPARNVCGGASANEQGYRYSPDAPLQCGVMSSPPFPIVTTPLRDNWFNATLAVDLESVLQKLIPALCSVTPEPTTVPTRMPTSAPTSVPTRLPTADPTLTPTMPTVGPTLAPTPDTTLFPTTMAPTPPTVQPTSSPTHEPTHNPTLKPSASPTTKIPTEMPSPKPTRVPTTNPTLEPIGKPTRKPTRKPSWAPTTLFPTQKPTRRPTARPSKLPTREPTTVPTTRPTLLPTRKPTREPTTRLPTMMPTTRAPSTLAPYSKKVHPAISLVLSGAPRDPGGESSVAISSDGSTAVVGGPGNVNDNGAIWVFVRTPNQSWVQQGPKLTCMQGSVLGYSVGVSADGNTVVGNVFRTMQGRIQAGGCCVFGRNTTGKWTKQGSVLVGKNAGVVQGPGYGVAISGNGRTILLGSPLENNGKGGVFVFVLKNGIWSQQGRVLTGIGASSMAHDANAVALSHDGNTALVSGLYDHDKRSAMWIFVRNTTTGRWSQQGPKQFVNGATNKGTSVALSGDGNRSIFSSSGKNSIWVLERTGETWARTAPLPITDLLFPGELHRVAISADGDTCAVAFGRYDPSTSNQFAALYKRKDNQWLAVKELFISKRNILGFNIALDGSGQAMLQSYLSGGYGVATWAIDLEGVMV